MMDNFDLRKYLAEGKLLKEQINTAAIDSREDYKDLFIGDKSQYDDPELLPFSDGEEHMVDLEPGMFQMIFWNNEGPLSKGFNSKEEYVKQAIDYFWGRDHFVDKFNLGDELEAAGDNEDAVFYKHIEDNLDMYYKELNELINDSEPDGDSTYGVVLLKNGKIVAGKALKF
jgi:hypothetical protein